MKIAEKNKPSMQESLSKLLSRLIFIVLTAAVAVPLADSVVFVRSLGQI